MTQRVNSPFLTLRFRRSAMTLDQIEELTAVLLQVHSQGALRIRHLSHRGLNRWDPWKLAKCWQMMGKPWEQQFS
jgi:hypothetical protein